MLPVLYWINSPFGLLIGPLAASFQRVLRVLILRKILRHLRQRHLQRSFKCVRRIY